MGEIMLYPKYTSPTKSKAKIVFFLGFQGPLSGQNELNQDAFTIQRDCLNELSKLEPDYFNQVFLKNIMTECDYLQDKHPITGKTIHPMEKKLQKEVLSCSLPLCDIMLRETVLNFCNMQNSAYLKGVDTAVVGISSSVSGFSDLYIEKILDILQKECTPLHLVKNQFAIPYIRDFKSLVEELTYQYAEDDDISSLEEFKLFYSKGQNDRQLYNYHLTAKALYLIKENFPLIIEEQNKYAPRSGKYFKNALEIAKFIKGIQQTLVLIKETGLNFIGTGDTSSGNFRMKSAIQWVKTLTNENDIPIIPVFIDDMKVENESIISEFKGLPQSFYERQVGSIKKAELEEYYLKASLCSNSQHF